MTTLESTAGVTPEVPVAIEVMKVAEILMEGEVAIRVAIIVIIRVIAVPINGVPRTTRQHGRCQKHKPYEKDFDIHRITSSLLILFP